jgi:hypothetical protein
MVGITVSNSGQARLQRSSLLVAALGIGQTCLIASRGRFGHVAAGTESPKRKGSAGDHHGQAAIEANQVRDVEHLKM